MANDASIQRVQSTNPPGGPSVPPPVRQRLQAIFQHAQKCTEKADYDYANDLYSQCVVEDPGNLIYLQHLLANLAKKHGDNKKGARFAALKVKGARMSLSKSIEKGQWQEAFQAGCNALKQNPWDAGTLILLARACNQLGHHECQLYCLRWALDAAGKDATVNREAAVALAALGQFDQAIHCWQRVLHAKPGNQEAEKAIARLSVDRTIQKGGYDQRMLAADGGGNTETLGSWVEGVGAPQPVVENTPAAENGSSTGRLPEEQRLLQAIEEAPAEIANYVALADFYSGKGRLAEAERALSRALSASGGDLKIRERLEDAQLRRIRQQVEVARVQAESQSSEEALQLARRMAAQANQAELEIYAARTQREPQNIATQFEFGLRLKQARKFREAIQAFQAARDDSRRKATVQIHLGECFQHIRQFRLAAGSYETAVDACHDMDQETKKLALYRAGVLATEMKDLDRAEKYLTDLAAIDFGYRDVADRLDKLAAMRDSV